MSTSQPARKLGKASKLLLPHEKELLNSGLIRDVTHQGASSIWLEAESSAQFPQDHCTVYRPMGDAEILYLVNNNQLPDTQPYQAIVEGEAGRQYAQKFLTGKKHVDTAPTTVVEFLAPRTLIDNLFKIQHKPEDGVMSMGLGNKAGGGLQLFNASLTDGSTTWRVVNIKRGAKQ